MKNTLIVAAMLAVASLATMRAVGEDRSDDAEKTPSIKEVMKLAMKDGLCKKVASGKAEDGDAEKLVVLFTALSKQEPPKGDAESWKAKTATLLAAAKACANGEEGATARLGKAANCKACHSVHKGK